jgi:hypothetical protein
VNEHERDELQSILEELHLLCAPTEEEMRRMPGNGYGLVKAGLRQHAGKLVARAKTILDARRC